MELFSIRIQRTFQLVSTAKDILIFFLMELMFFEKNKFFQRVGWCSGRNHFYRNSEGVSRNLLQEFAKLVARSAELVSGFRTLR